MKIDSDIGGKKQELLAYFGNRAKEILVEVSDDVGRKNFKKITQALQPAIRESRDALTRAVEQQSRRDDWTSSETLKAMLLVHHAANVAMLEYRHRVWPYEYMAFSRRIGELWESFIGTCFHYPVDGSLSLEVPPLFSDIRERLKVEVSEYIEQLPIDHDAKENLNQYYHKVWLLVDAGEIKLELDIHCEKSGEHLNIDLKSGFGSNEKGNTNRLLVVASIYRNIVSESYRNLLIVRTPEAGNNHYLQTLKRSKLWEVSCGAEAYRTIGEVVDFDLSHWISENINWQADLSDSMYQDLVSAELTKYLEW